GLFSHEAGVEEQRRGDVEGELALEVASQDLGRDRAAHVVRDDRDRLVRESADERLDDVGVAPQRVELIARLVGKPETEEVENEQSLPAEPIERVPPVVRA